MTDRDVTDRSKFSDDYDYDDDFDVEVKYISDDAVH
jgi:hypothetical protein